MSGTKRTPLEIGRKVWFLTPLEHTYAVEKNGRRYSKWFCKCVCGKVKCIRENDIQRGTVKSCGCLTQRLKAESITGAYLKRAEEFAEANLIPETPMRKEKHDSLKGCSDEWAEHGMMESYIKRKITEMMHETKKFLYLTRKN